MDSKRSKKYTNLKDSKRTIILSKRDEDTISNAQPQQPKILLKAKEPTPVIPSISIALRDGVKKLPQTLTNVNVAANKDCKELTAPVIVEQPVAQVPTMQKPVNIVSDHYLLNTQAFDFIVESNINFFVVGCVGTQGIGKSTLMNILCSNNFDANNLSTEGVFQTRNIKERIFSSAPTTEGIEMFITKDRIIFLDCSPLLCNPYKKDHVLNEIDDLKMLIFLFNVCHLLIVVQDETINMNVIRLLMCAEMMKPNFDRIEYSANVMFVKNWATTKDFSADHHKQTERLLKLIFKQSKVKIYPGTNRCNDNEAWSNVGMKISSVENCPVNLFAFPELPRKKSKTAARAHIEHVNIDRIITEFRQHVFMSPRPQFQTAMLHGTFTEKHWSQLVTNVWESHKNNYFLRKYETFKEKEWITRPSVT